MFRKYRILILVLVPAVFIVFLALFLIKDKNILSVFRRAPVVEVPALKESPVLATRFGNFDDLTFSDIPNFGGFVGGAYYRNSIFLIGKNVIAEFDKNTKKLTGINTGAISSFETATIHGNKLYVFKKENPLKPGPISPDQNSFLVVVNMDTKLIEDVVDVNITLGYPVSGLTLVSFEDYLWARCNLGVIKIDPRDLGFELITTPLKDGPTFDVSVDPKTFGLGILPIESLSSKIGDKYYAFSKSTVYEITEDSLLDRYASISIDPNVILYTRAYSSQFGNKIVLVSRDYRVPFQDFSIRFHLFDLNERKFINLENAEKTYTIKDPNYTYIKDLELPVFDQDETGNTVVVKNEADGNIVAKIDLTTLGVIFVK